MRSARDSRIVSGALATDAAIEAVVLLCAGRTFIAGADIAEFDAPLREPDCHAVFALIEGWTSR